MALFLNDDDDAFPGVGNLKGIEVHVGGPSVLLLLALHWCAAAPADSVTVVIFVLSCTMSDEENDADSDNGAVRARTDGLPPDHIADLL